MGKPNIREQMLAKTADLKPASSMPTETAEDGGARPAESASLQTAPGLGVALTTAQLRIQELEKSGATSQIKVAEISPNPWQPRRAFNQQKMSELAASIRTAGLMQPIVVRRVKGDYQIVAGERRWRAHQMLEMTHIKAIVVEVTDSDMAGLALTENMTRDDLADYEIAISIKRAEKEFPNRTRLAEFIGKNRTELYRYLSFDSLPEFIRNDLNLEPHVLGASAAEDIVSALKKTGEAGQKTAKELWSQVKSGDLTQTRFVKLISQSGSPESRIDGAARNIDKFFAGKAQAGNITKDSSGLTIKIRPGMLTDDQEKQMRELLARFFSMG
jgi:ParB family transcriptional regulator, chromosome partitioning protein